MSLRQYKIPEILHICIRIWMKYTGGLWTTTTCSSVLENSTPCTTGMQNWIACRQDILTQEELQFLHQYLCVSWTLIRCIIPSAYRGVGHQMQTVSKMVPQNFQNKREDKYGPLSSIHPQPHGLLLPAMVTTKYKYNGGTWNNPRQRKWSERNVSTTEKT